MSGSQPLVSIGLPARDSERVIEGAVRTVLAQRYENLELVISDNASDDGTEQLCREFAAADQRVRYHRQPRNIGLLANFQFVMRQAGGQYFRWIGDDDSLEPDYATRCVERFAEDERLFLVSTRQTFAGPAGETRTGCPPIERMGSDCPAERFAEMMALLTAGYLLADPLYAMFRRDPLSRIPRRNILREDEVFAAKLALAGPWGFVPEVLAHRGWDYDPLPRTARRLGVPAWQAWAATALQCREILRYLDSAPLTSAQRRRARAAVARHYLRRQQRVAERAGRKIVTQGRRVLMGAGVR